MDGMSPMHAPGRMVEAARTVQRLRFDGWPEGAAVRAANRLDRELLALELACSRHRRRAKRKGLILGLIGGTIVGFIADEDDGP